MSLIQIWRMLLARRYLIIVLALLGAVLGLVVAKSIPRLYQAKARLILNVLKPDPVTGESVSPRGLDSFVQAQTELIRDYRVTGAVVDKFGWTQQPTLREAYARRTGAEELDFRSWLAKRVSDSTAATLTPNSPILEISYTSTSPDTARRVADALRDAFVEQTIEMRRADAQRNAVWFRGQTEKLKRELAAAEARKSSFERANNIVLQDDNTDTEAAKLKAMANASPIAPAVIAGPVVAPSSGALATVDAQLATARQTLGPNHPEIIALQRQRASLAAAVARESSAGRGGGAPSIAGAINAQTQKVLAQRGLVGEAQRLAGEVSVLRDQVLKTAQRAADFELQAQTTESGMDVLGAAVTPLAPLNKPTILFVAAGLFLGLGLGVVLAMLLELAFRRVRGVEDLSFDGLPVLGAMHADPQGAPPTLLQRWLGAGRRKNEGVAI